MAASSSQTAQVVKTTGDFHNEIRQAFGGVAKLIFGDATNFHSGDGMLHAHARPGQVAIVPFLGRRQRVLLGLFFGCRCWRTLGA